MYDFSWTEGTALANAILSYKPPPIHLQYMYTSVHLNTKFGFKTLFFMLGMLK